LLGFDAATFAFLGAQAWRTHIDRPTTAQPVDARAAESGFRLLRRNELLVPIVLTWLFFFLYGPVEDALPVYVAHDLHGHAGLPGAYWTSFGVGALVSTLVAGGAPQPRHPSYHPSDHRRLGQLPDPLRRRAAPLGMSIGGPIVASLGAGWTLSASGAATVLIAALATGVWRPSPEHSLAPTLSRSLRGLAR
jgi:hypothetical protein